MDHSAQNGGSGDDDGTGTGTGAAGAGSAGRRRPGSRRPAHRLLPMTGRDPGEEGRATTPLELLFDLTFVVAVGTAAHHFAELLAAGHPAQATSAFALAMFSISNAWIGFSWFASAFGTDDWLFRVLTMVVMIGVVVLALGLPAMYHSIETGHRLDLRLIVSGYVVMRVAMVLQWWRVARDSRRYREVGRANMRWTAIAQLGWVAVGFARLPLPAVVAGVVVLGVLELLLPVLTQGRAGGTPWHPHHVAERYGLFAIITLGEGVVGTVGSSGDLLGGASGADWTANAVAVVVAGVGLTFGMWWAYFLTPFGEVLTHCRGRGYLFGYGHIPLFAGIAGAGGGLHVAGLYLEHHAHAGPVAVVLSLAAPVGLFLLMVYVLHTLLLGAGDPFHVLLISGTLAVLVGAVALAAGGAPVAVCLLVVMLAPFVTVLGYETVGHRHQREMLEALRA